MTLFSVSYPSTITIGNKFNISISPLFPLRGCDRLLTTISFGNLTVSTTESDILIDKKALELNITVRFKSSGCSSNDATTVIVSAVVISCLCVLLVATGLLVIVLFTVFWVKREHWRLVLSDIILMTRSNISPDEDAF
jgi:hypothetical protein